MQRQTCLTVIVLFSGLSLSMAAQGRATVDPSAIERGRVLFDQHCASCHGKSGKGDGFAASTMTPRPVDVTGLERRYGAFLPAQLESAIRGTNPTVVHRAPGMALWTAIFRSDTSGNRTAADARMRDVIAFIESIQAK